MSGKKNVKGMSGMGKERLMWELEKFVATRLRPCREFHDIYELCHDTLYVEERLRHMDDWWDWHGHMYRNHWGEIVCLPQLTNHEICHEMFWNAFRGRSRMYIQIENLRFDRDNIGEEDSLFCQLQEDETVTLQCSLLTLQMLDYDAVMFRAMSDPDDEEYKKAAQKFYRPYLFSYVMEINSAQYEKLRELQGKAEEELPYNEEGFASHLWLACTFHPDSSDSYTSFDGYVVQSASGVNKIRAELYIIEDKKTPVETVRSILDTYQLRHSCVKDDHLFIQTLEQKLGCDRLSTIDVYKVGNGNCVYAQGKGGTMGFFYDIGFHYRHRPKEIAPGVTYAYSDTMRKIYAQKPSFFILSHWDMDHIAGSAAARKDFLDQDWFAPDCHDACADAKRLAKYLDIKDHLFLAGRTLPGRLIGKVDINGTAASPLATYRFYMGAKASCDRSLPNCEGIVMEYTDQITQKTVLMMGDVNYASFNKARKRSSEPLFADTSIDYLIAPHHGSQHTDYDKITDGKKPKKGTLAIICCTNSEDENRPNGKHKKELEKRFGDNVRTTEEDGSGNQCISINL